MGKLLFLGVTALLAVRYIVRSGQKNNPKVTAPTPKTIDVPPLATLPPSEQ